MAVRGEDGDALVAALNSAPFLSRQNRTSRNARRGAPALIEGRIPNTAARSWARAHATVERLGSLVVENAVLSGRKVSIHCADGVIADIRDDGAGSPVAQRGATDRLDGRGYLVAPGLIK